MKISTNHKIIKKEEYEAKNLKNNWLMSNILSTTNAMQWYKFYRRKYMLIKKNTNLAAVINLYDNLVTQERLNQGEANNSYDEQIVNLRAELAASR